MSKSRIFGFILCLLTLLLFPALVFSQTVDPVAPVAPVDREELGAGGSTSVDFINYEGPYARIETRGQIQGIGTTLGTAVNTGGEETARHGSTSRYFVIHSVSDPEGDRLDADIFGLGVDAGVDHIRNLRLIIQGYLEAAYRYSASDASLLSEYITVYNAVFRGNWNYFGGRYKTAVIQQVDQTKAGLSVRFDEWPGRTLMLIPLNLGRSGSLSALDTSALTRPEVIDEMRSQDDMGLDSRKDMVDIKEREAEEAASRAAEERRAADESEKQAVQARSEAAAERESIERDRERAREDAASGRATPAGQRRTEEQLAAREEAAAQKEAEAEQKEAAAAEQRREAEKDEQLAEQKSEEAYQERQDIARDQQVLIARQDGRDQPAARSATQEAFVTVRITSGDSAQGRLVRIDSSTAAELSSGNMDTVNARSLVQVGSRIIAVAGENRGQGAVRLVEINQETLEMTRQSDSDIHPQSLIWQNGGGLYAIAVRDGRNYLARFNANTLAAEAQSAIPVHPWGTPVFQGNTVLIQRENGQAAILNTADLSEKQ
jgi:pyruvate/2-oxoglutarate dehydrogenase complex dihydrolipoamide acyltransferase (E2) component